MSFVITLLSLFSSSPEPRALVQTNGTEIEAVFVPAGFVGPVIALPLDMEVF
jgi:hypothetical protein